MREISTGQRGHQCHKNTNITIVSMFYKIIVAKRQTKQITANGKLSFCLSVWRRPFCWRGITSAGKYTGKILRINRISQKATRLLLFWYRITSWSKICCIELNTLHLSYFRTLILLLNDGLIFLLNYSWLKSDKWRHGSWTTSWKITV